MERRAQTSLKHGRHTVMELSSAWSMVGYYIYDRVGHHVTMKNNNPWCTIGNNNSCYQASTFCCFLFFFNPYLYPRLQFFFQVSRFLFILSHFIFFNSFFFPPFLTIVFKEEIDSPSLTTRSISIACKDKFAFWCFFSSKIILTF